MRISVPSETAPGERRVSLVPDSIARLVKAGHEVVVQQGAGVNAGFRDAQYSTAGARLAASAAETCAGAAVVTRVQPPSAGEIAMIDPGASVISLMKPGRNAELVAALSARKLTGLALELVPRISRAQSMDVLSSQSTVAGYKAVLVGAALLPRFLPMLTTAAGSIQPSRVFVIGAGVAGLQAIATARRLGAVVSGFDIRPAAREQVLSLGATFVGGDSVSADAQAKGGYARAQTDEERAKTLAAMAAHLPEVDMVVTTAQVPGRAAPKLISADMVQTMRAGSVIVDVAAESGGNCELTVPGETIVKHDVTILAPLDLASSVPFHASQMFSRNVLTLLQHLTGKETTMTIDLDDEITGAMVITHAGAARA